MLFGRSKITFLQIGAGGIEIRYLIIWEEADGDVEYLVKLWRTRLVSLCHQEHLLQRKLLWFGLQYLLGLFDAERTNRVSYRIVAMTETRIDMIQNVAVTCRMELSDLQVLIVGSQRGVSYLENCFLISQMTSLNLLLESFPVFRCSLIGKELAV